VTRATRAKSLTRVSNPLLAVVRVINHLETRAMDWPLAMLGVEVTLRWITLVLQEAARTRDGRLLMSPSGTRGSKLLTEAGVIATRLVTTTRL
jgi:hypothetical protein